jgi:RNA polymerase sigma-70 factor (ECF subfamily)
MWTEFCNRYRPLVVSFSKRLGLSDADAQDAAQETLAVFVAAYRNGKYDKTKGRLRSWLFGIAHRKARDIGRRNRRERIVADRGSNTGLVDQIPDEHGISQIWEEEWRQSILKASLAEVRRQVEPATMQAFELLMLKLLPTDQVATRLEMSPNAVLKAKRRVLARLREQFTHLQDNW